MLKNSKASEIQPENYEISSLLIRVMLIESLYLMCKATVGDKSCLVNEMAATLWHILVIYYFSNRFIIINFFFKNGNFLGIMIFTSIFLCNCLKWR